MISQLHQLLLELIPGGAKTSLSVAQAKQVLAEVRPRDAPAAPELMRLEAQQAGGRSFEHLFVQAGPGRGRLALALHRPERSAPGAGRRAGSRMSSTGISGW
jgi:hypothetical protein